VRHYHVVFTVSHVFNDLWRANPRVMGDLLFHSATDTTDLDTDAWIEQHTCPVCGTPLIVSSYIPSSVTGRYSPRVPIGSVFAPSTLSWRRP
jgi:hypothetical protein